MLQKLREYLVGSYLPLILTLLSACASDPMVVTRTPAVFGEIDDLAIATDDALGLADLLGTDKVLVVFDLDNTLLAMEQDLGSDQWYYWQKDLKDEDPCSTNLVGSTLDVQGALYFASAMRATQADAAGQIMRLQQAGFKVIIVTSRGHGFRLQTFRELRRNGFSFYASAIGPPGGYPDTFIPDGADRPVRFEDGVFFTAGQHKGDMLQALLEKTGTPPPAAIVVVDDKKSNLRDVMNVHKNEDTSVHAWRYTHEDAQVDAFDSELAVREWESAKPALQQLQAVFGPDNFDFPEYVVPEDCAVAEQSHAE